MGCIDARIHQRPTILSKINYKKENNGVLSWYTKEFHNLWSKSKDVGSEFLSCSPKSTKEKAGSDSNLGNDEKKEVAWIPISLLHFWSLNANTVHNMSLHEQIH